VDELSLPVLAVSATVIALSGLVHGTLGMGFPVVATPLLALMVDVRTAILLTLLPTATVNLASVLRSAGWGATLQRFWPLALAGVAGSVVGSQLLVTLDPAPFKLLLAVLVLAYLAVSRGRGPRLDWVTRHRHTGMLAFGLAAGLAGGTTNVMVTLLIVYALELDLERPTMVAMFNLCFLAGKLSQIGVFTVAGLLTLPLVGVTAGLSALAAAALWTGMRLQDRIPAETYRQVVKTVLLVLALVLVAQYLAGA
jgi:uncharacterized membrane protein YfcA